MIDDDIIVDKDTHFYAKKSTGEIIYSVTDVINERYYRYDFTNTAIDYGVHFHSVFENLLKNRNLKNSNIIANYIINNYIDYLFDFFKIDDATKIKTEQSFYSQKYNLCGTIDAFFVDEDKNKVLIFDHKTVKNAHLVDFNTHKKHKIQLSAYYKLSELAQYANAEIYIIYVNRLSLFDIDYSIDNFVNFVKLSEDEIDYYFGQFLKMYDQFLKNIKIYQIPKMSERDDMLDYLILEYKKYVFAKKQNEKNVDNVQSAIDLLLAKNEQTTYISDYGKISKTGSKPRVYPAKNIK